MNYIAIEGGGYDSATSAFVGGNQVAALYYNGLTAKLSGYGAMAGDDATSTDFSAEYDTAAREAVSALNDTVDAFATFAELCAASIDNHRRANNASRFQGEPEIYDGTAKLTDKPVDVAAYTPPTSLGGDNEDVPAFWNEIVDHLEGFAWPNANTTTLRSAASTWRNAGGDLDRVALYCDTAVTYLQQQKSDEIPAAVAAARDLKDQITILAGAFRSLGESCDTYAQEVDAQREVIKGIVRDMAIEAGLSLVAGGVVAFFTVGAGAGAGAAIAGWRIVAAARKILKALRALKAVAKAGAVAKLTTTVAKVKPLRAVLARFKRAKSMKHADEAADVPPPRDSDAGSPGPGRGAPTSLDDLQGLRGASRAEVEDLIPDDWEAKPLRKGSGVRYFDPDHRGVVYSIEDGWPNAVDPVHAGPYLKISKDGKIVRIPLEGNPAL